MKLSIDPDWLREMGEKDDNGFISVGGLVSRIGTESTTLTTLTTPRAALQAMRQRLDRPEAWCRGNPRDADGKAVNSDDPSAVAWPMFVITTGTPVACSESDVYLILLRAMNPRMADLTSWETCCERGVWLTDLIHWNDDPTRTHADVLALLGRAIEIAR